MIDQDILLFLSVAVCVAHVTQFVVRGLLSKRAAS